VFSWTEQADGTWSKKLIHNFNCPVWRVSWSTMGSILAVSDGNGTTTLWKETLDGIWQQVQQ
jgi:protein transport protein SEC13